MSSFSHKTFQFLIRYPHKVSELWQMKEILLNVKCNSSSLSFATFNVFISKQRKWKVNTRCIAYVAHQMERNLPIQLITLL